LIIENYFPKILSKLRVNYYLKDIQGEYERSVAKTEKIDSIQADKILIDWGLKN